MLKSVVSTVTERFSSRPANLNIGAVCAYHLWDLVDPIHACADFSEDRQRFENSVLRFDPELQGFYAALCYLSIVETSGHQDYFSSAHAMQYEDALDFFMSSAMPEVAALMEQAGQHFTNGPLMAVGMGVSYDAELLVDFDHALACLDPVPGLARYARRRPDFFAAW